MCYDRAMIWYTQCPGLRGECFGQHSGSDQQADLGDGHGYRAYSLSVYIRIFKNNKPRSNVYFRPLIACRYLYRHPWKLLLLLIIGYRPSF